MEQQWRITELNVGRMTYADLVAAPKLWATTLFREILQEYEDTKGGRPTETIILSFARLFKGESAKFLDDLVAFQDDLLKLNQVRDALGLTAAGR
jgi:hypothetical protein